MKETTELNIQDYPKDIQYFFECQQNPLEIESKWRLIDAQIALVERMIEAMSYGRSTD